LWVVALSQRHKWAAILGGGQRGVSILGDKKTRVLTSFRMVLKNLQTAVGAMRYANYGLSHGVEVSRLLLQQHDQLRS
jgi:hypothetical protein